MRKLEAILEFLRYMQQAQKVAVKMAFLSASKLRREDFSDQEWGEFIDCYQQLIALDYFLSSLKRQLADWCTVDGVNSKDFL